MLKICISFFVSLYLGVAHSQQQQMQPLTQEQMQRLEQARKRKAQAVKQRTPAQASPTMPTKPALKTMPVKKPAVKPIAKPTVKQPTVPPRKVAPAKLPPKPKVAPPAPPTNDSLESTTMDHSAPVSSGSSQPTETLARKRLIMGNPKSFYYLSTSYLSFADQIFAKVNGQKSKARSVFTGYAFGADYTKYFGRYIYSWNIFYLSGVVDIQRVLGTTYPRKKFYGVQSGPEIGYRVNADMDFTWGVSLLYRDIEDVGQSFAMSNQLNIRFRFSPRLTFFQTLGNYGKPTSYSYSLGLRWLL